LAEEWNDMVLEAVSRGTGMSSMVDLKAVGDSVTVENIMQFACVDPQIVHISDIHLPSQVCARYNRRHLGLDLRQGSSGGRENQRYRESAAEFSHHSQSSEDSSSAMLLRRLYNPGWSVRIFNFLPKLLREITQQSFRTVAEKANPTRLLS
jgi:hypothetical protein